MCERESEEREGERGRECIVKLYFFFQIASEMASFPRVTLPILSTPNQLPTHSPFRICFLGTGSAIPSIYRNVSGIFLDMEEGGIMLDCGEGSFSQLSRLFGISHAIQFLPFFSVSDFLFASFSLSQFLCYYFLTHFFANMCTDMCAH